MSSATRAELIRVLSRAVMRMQDATESFDETVGEVYGIGAAERRCLSALLEGPRYATDIAQDVGLTRPAATALVDRLVKRGLASRSSPPSDRRRVLVASTPAADRIIAETYLLVAAEGAVFLEGFSEPELKALLRFVEGSAELQLKHAAQLRANTASFDPGGSTS